MNAPPRTQREVVARLVAQAGGRLMRGDDPRLSHQIKTGESAVTDSPANQISHPSTKGSSSNG